MTRSLLAIALCIVPALALAATPKTVPGQIVKDVRAMPAAKGLSMNARGVKTLYLNGAVGSFSFTAVKPGPKGLPGTIYNVSGDFNAEKGPASITDVNIAPAPFQPRSNQ